MMDISLYTFLQTHKIYNSKSDSFWLCWALVVALALFVVEHGALEHRLSCPESCAILVPPTRDQTSIPFPERQILNHWTMRDVPITPREALSFIWLHQVFALAGRIFDLPCGCVGYFVP